MEDRRSRKKPRCLTVPAVPDLNQVLGGDPPQESVAQERAKASSRNRDGRGAGVASGMACPSEPEPTGCSNHATFQQGCAQCIFSRHKAKWTSKTVSVRPTVFGSRRKKEQVCWLAERPALQGGKWGIGCRLCADAVAKMAQFEGAEGAEVRRRAREAKSRLSTKWARFEVNSAKTMQMSCFEQHAKTSLHRMAERIMWAPPSQLMACLPTPAEALWRGPVPQVEDWLRTLRVVQTPVSFQAAQQHSRTEQFITDGAAGGRCVTRKAWKQLIQTMASVCRKLLLEALMASQCVSLVTDDKGQWRLVKFQCNVDDPSVLERSGLNLLACASNMCELGDGRCPSYVVGIISVFRPEADTPNVQEFDEDHGVRVADSLNASILGFVQDEQSAKSLLDKIRFFVADGAVLKAGRIFREKYAPNIKLIHRDLAHTVRPCCSKPVEADAELGPRLDALFSGPQALLPAIQASHVWKAKLEAAQKQVLSSRDTDDRPSLCLDKIYKHFSFAKHRWESTERPRMRYLMLLHPIAVLLSHQWSDTRQAAGVRNLAYENLKGLMTCKGPLQLALSTDWSATMHAFLREFDVENHDPAKTRRQRDRFVNRIRSLFTSGSLLSEKATDTMTARTVRLLAQPLRVTSHGRTINLFHKNEPDSDILRAGMQKLQLATDVAVERIMAELPSQSTLLAFCAFDLQSCRIAWPQAGVG